MKKYNYEIADKMREQNKSITEIARATGIPYKTLHSYYVRKAKALESAEGYLQNIPVLDKVLEKYPEIDLCGLCQKLLDTEEKLGKIDREKRELVELLKKASVMLTNFIPVEDSLHEYSKLSTKEIKRKGGKEYK